MKNEIKLILEKSLDSSYRALTKDGADKAIGAVRVITGLSQGDQSFTHIENIFVRNNSIQLGKLLNDIEKNIKDNDGMITKTKEELSSEIKELKNKNQNLESRIVELENFLLQLKRSQID